MPQSLKSRKHKLVHDAIYDAAIDLFSEGGFDAITVEQVAEAAGVSRRSFFRYFASKDDLLAQNVVTFGEAQVASIRQCPLTLAQIEVVRRTVTGVLERVAQEPRTRQVIAIAERSKSASQAHMSRLLEVEESISTAFAARIRGANQLDSRPRLLAGLTTLIMSVALMAWFRGEFDSIQNAAEAVFLDLSLLFASSEKTNVTARRTSDEEESGLVAPSIRSRKRPSRAKR